VRCCFGNPAGFTEQERRETVAFEMPVKAGRGTIVCRLSPGGEQQPPDRVEALEPDQVAAFRAFRRPPQSADHALRDDRLTASVLASHLNPDLARRVYDGVEGTIDLVPGRNTTCCIATTAGTGERVSGSTSTELAAQGAHGFTSTGRGRAATFRGLLAASVRDLRVITASGETITVPVNADDAYWITITDPVDQILTLTDGTQRHIPFARPGPGRVQEQP
jgi:hypothetical protein